jgi:8-amino-7-oxononanoate synthase
MVLGAQRSDLDRLQARGRLRTLAPRAGIDFASNDYLGLSRDPALAAAVAAALAAGVALGAGGSRLLRGNAPEHERLEAAAARFFAVEAALFFANGYAANTALFATLPQRDDLVLYDALIHASAHDGMRLGRARACAVPHNAPEAIEAAIREHRRHCRSGMIWIAVESLYSMDGDRAPLVELAEIADRHGAMLVIDEAHATGVWGPEGRGLAAPLAGRPNVVTLKTFGKALGCEGALVCGAATVRDFLVARARPFIFSTAPSPLMAVAAQASLELAAAGDDRRRRLRALIAAAERLLAPLGVRPTGTQILPLIVGDDGAAMALAAGLQADGFDVRGIRPPTVPAGTARLRISLTLNAGEADLAALADALHRRRS